MAIEETKANESKPEEPQKAQQVEQFTVAMETNVITID